MPKLKKNIRAMGTLSDLEINRVDKTQSPNNQKERKITLLILGCILFLAIIVRLWGIKAGFPEVFYVDANKIIVPSQRIAFNLLQGKFDIDPQFYQYPTLLYNTLAVEYVALAVGGYYYSSFLGSKISYHDYIASLFQDKSKRYTFHLLAQLTNALAGVATVLVIFFLGVALSRGDKRAGLIAALFLALMYFHVKETKYPMTDGVMVLFSTLATLFIIHMCDRGRVKDFIYAGMFIGLGAATKYMPLALLLPFGLAAMVRWYQEVGWRWNEKVVKGVALGLLSLLLAFVIGSPITIFRTRTYGQRLTVEATSKGGVEIGATQTGYFDYFFSKTPIWNEPFARNSFAGAMGLPMFLLSLIGLGYMLFLLNREGIKARGVYLVLIIYAVCYYFYLAKPMVMRVIRYFLMLLPLLAAIAACFLVDLIEKIKVKEGMQNLIIGMGALLIVLPTAVSTIRYDYLMMHQDTRIEAGQWIRENIPPHSSLLTSNLYAPSLEDSDFRVYFYDKNIASKKQLYFDLLIASKIDYVIISSYFYDRYFYEESLWADPEVVSHQRKFYQDLDERAKLIKVFENNLKDKPGPTIKVYKIAS